ncbi:MAG: extracellular solute-binding protein [Anaerolineae bacterium]|nr:extracellular solute-binding protein [Anaerolineae bacterium]
MKKWSLRVLLLTLMLVPFASVSAQDEPTDIVYNFFDECPTDATGALDIWLGSGLWDAIIAEFQAECPGLAITFASRSGDDNITGLQLALSAGEGGCDVCNIEVKDFGQFVDSGALLDLTDRVAPFRDLIPADAWQYVTGSDGKIYGIPVDVGPVVMYYRRDVFELAGLPSDPDSVSEMVATWQDYLSVCQTIKANTGLFCFPLSRADNDARIYEMILWSQGLGYYNSAGELAVNSPENVAALELMGEFWTDELVADTSSWTDEWYAGFSSFDEPVASIVIAGWMELFLPTWIAPDTAGLWGVARMPGGGEASPRAALDGGSALFIPAHSATADAAWAFIENTVLADDVMLAFRTDPTRGGVLPAITSVYADPSMVRPLAFFGEQNTTALYLEVYQNVPAVRIWGPDYTAINDVIRTAIQRFALGEATAEEALTAAQSELAEVVR